MARGRSPCVRGQGISRLKRSQHGNVLTVPLCPSAPPANPPHAPQTLPWELLWATWGFQTTCCLSSRGRRLRGGGAILCCSECPGGEAPWLGASGRGAQCTPEGPALDTRNRERIIFLFLPHFNINWTFPPMAQTWTSVRRTAARLCCGPPAS